MNDELKGEIRDTLLYRLPKSIAHKYLYSRSHNAHLNLRNPELYDEKIHWLMVNVYDESYAKYADKILVRDYVKECGLENILIPLVGKGIFNDANQIRFEELPEKFILKANHGSGDKYYVICDDKSTFDYTAAIKKMSKAMRTNYAKHYCQYHYAGIKPALICEQYLMTNGQNRLTDYKVVCSYGKPFAILVCRDRNNGRDYYSPDWKYLEYTKPEFRSGIIEEKPLVLQEMLRAASVLSKPLPYARVDFYVVNDRLYFGEITLTASGGIHRNLSIKGQMELGKCIRI